MASGDVLTRLQQRASTADQLVSELKAQLHVLKQSAASKVCKLEEERLAAENAALRQEVQKLVQELAAAEARHGVQQIQLPNSKSTTESAYAASVVEPKPAKPNGSILEDKAKKESPASKEDKKQTVIKTSAEPQKAVKSEKAAKADKKTAESKPSASAGMPSGGEKVDVSRLNMRIGQITDVKKHPDADSLYVEEVDVGEERKRTIVSGLVKHVPIEQMQGRIAVFLLNLKPAKMRGVLSEGMIMCASSPDAVEIIVPPAGVVIGDRVTVEGYPGAPDEQLNPKKKKVPTATLR